MPLGTQDANLCNYWPSCFLIRAILSVPVALTLLDDRFEEVNDEVPGATFQEFGTVHAGAYMTAAARVMRFT